MTDCLTPDQYEALRTDRDSWKATAEELDDKNVNKAFRQRHEMREAGLQKQLSEAQADVLALAKAARTLLTSHDALYQVAWELLGSWSCRRAVDPIEPMQAALARPGVVRVVEGETP